MTASIHCNVRDLLDHQFGRRLIGAGLLGMDLRELWRFRGLRLDRNDFLRDDRDQFGRWLLSDLSEWRHDGGSERRRFRLDLLELSLRLHSRLFRWVHRDF